VREIADEMPITRPAVLPPPALLSEAGLVTAEARGRGGSTRCTTRASPRCARTSSSWGDAAARFRLARTTSTPAVIEPRATTFEVRCSPAAAFELWTARTSLGGRRATPFSAEPASEIVIEPRPGGRIFERTAAGSSKNLGRVLAWGAAAAAEYTCTCARTPEDATEVEIAFSPAGEWERA